jgi:hypothetical protein
VGVFQVAFNGYIKATGEGLIMDEEKDGEMVELLLSMKRRLDGVLEGSFHRNEAFGNSMKDAFEQFINQRHNKPAELIAKFLDAKLRTGVKGVSEEELEGTLDDALVLFRYIQVMQLTILPPPHTPLNTVITHTHTHTQTITRARTHTHTHTHARAHTRAHAHVPGMLYDIAS